VQHDAAQRDPSLMMWIRPNPVFRRLPPAALPFITILAKTALHQKGRKMEMIDVWVFYDVRYSRRRRRGSVSCHADATFMISNVPRKIISTAT
jgi:hypothetical protein